jgi:hypothetical protein
MIPEFPQFKLLELTDKKDVEAFTSKFPPYSDFNFASLWCWNLEGEMRLSILNNNLVVHFTNYLTSEPFYSFLGDKEVDETASILLDFSIEKGLKPKLSLVPEIVALKLDKTKFSIEEDPNNFDYVYNVNLVYEYKGEKFYRKRKKYNYFLKNFPAMRAETLDLKNIATEKDVLQLDEEWLKEKMEKNINYKFNANELVAIDRFFQLGMLDIFGVGIFDDKKLIAYSFFEMLPNGFSINHFSKADSHYKYIYDYLERESAKILKSLGCSFLNYEQDLGILGLRENKQTFVSTYLKKFTVGFMNL